MRNLLSVAGLFVIRRDLTRATKAIHSARTFLIEGNYVAHNYQLEQAIHHLRSAMVVPERKVK